MSAEMGIIKETQVRLFRALFLDPAFQPKVEKKNQTRREDRTKTIRATNPSLDPINVMLAGMQQELNESRVINAIQSRVYGQMLEILLSHLTEKSQREATQKMRELSADEVFKDVA